MIGEVLSRTDPRADKYRDVCYEWEDECAKYFDVPVRRITPIIAAPDQKAKKNPIKLTIKKLFPVVSKIKSRINMLRTPKLEQDINRPLSLCFVMFPREISVFYGNNLLPVFLDIWSDENFEFVARSTQKLRLFYVTSVDVYHRFKALYPKSNVRCMFLSVADQYFSENFAAYRNKYIDVFMPGRGNPVLHKYMLRYADEHRNIKYVYRRDNWECRSTDESISLMAADRTGYMNMLASSKVSIVGCSGIDGAREETYGICFATPRFYESAVMGCALIGRYPDNEEFRRLNMSQYCPNITSYEHFCECLERALAQSPEELYAQNRGFIINSLTSKRAEQIQHDLEALS